MPKLRDLTGQKFGKLTVIERDGSTAYNKALWRCRCDCGNETFVVGSHLISGNTRSCGCSIKERAIERNGIHLHSGTRLYNIWKNMRQRCNNENVPCYRFYGGKGVSVCAEWENYTNFEKWAFSNGYQDDLTIDRIDGDGNYEPNNCRWVTMVMQSRNTSRNRIIEYNGETHCLAEWADILGISRKILDSRINRYNWSVERAFTQTIRVIRR